jgi:hypothetical protein
MAYFALFLLVLLIIFFLYKTICKNGKCCETARLWLANGLQIGKNTVRAIQKIFRKS